MDSRPSRHSQFIHKKLPGGWMILLIGFICTQVAALYVHKKNISEDELRMNFEVNAIMKRIQARLDIYEGALIQTRAFLWNVEPVMRNQLRQYIKDTEIFERSPGLQGLGYAEVFPGNALEDHQKKMKTVLADYKVWPAGEREIYTSIIVLEPSSWANRKAIGYDMFQDPKRREAMLKARDLNQVIMTKKIQLVQEKDRPSNPGLNIYLPHYKKGAQLDSVNERRSALIGYIYSPFKVNNLFGTIFKENHMTLDVEIAHSDSPEELLYDFDTGEQKFQKLSRTRKMQLFGQEFILKFSPLPSFKPAATGMKILGVMLAGVICTLILLWIWYLSKRQLEVISEVSNERARLLEKEKEHVTSRDEFLSIASHELKTPLTSLKMKAQMMMRAINKNEPNVFSPEKIVNLVDLINTQSTRLNRLVDDMLDISRIRTGRLKIERQEVKLREIVKDVVDRLSTEFVRVTGNFPQVKIDDEIIGYWDRLRIEQVITNLLTNALRYGEHKKVVLHICRAGRMAKIEVIDYGIGIARENINKIFERFERGGIAASEVSGLGLGLFISNKIVMAHGGFIDVKSEVGHGSTFTVQLPLEEDHSRA